MRYKRVRLCQRNMYCSMCLLNVATLLAENENIVAFSVNLDSKLVTIKSRDGTLSERDIQTLINGALTTGSVAARASERRMV